MIAARLRSLGKFIAGFTIGYFAGCFVTGLGIGAGIIG